MEFLIVWSNFSSGKTGRGGSASGLDIKKEKQGQSPRPTNRYVN